ncbi:MAG: hypothetical protein H6995_11070 [Pseudomonadales bacterium]|nr:hypothetical protein [Pseudomonadales bacterium]
MSHFQVIKATGIWLLFVMAAIINGVLREDLLTPWFGAALALPLSGILLSIFIFIITYLLVSLIASSKQTTYLTVGLLWAALTLSFEFLFGHYFLGKQWLDITKVFNPSEGNLFILVIFVTLISPRIAAKLKNLI